VALFCCGICQKAAAQEPRWELKPYRVQVVVAGDGSAAITNRRLLQVQDFVAANLARLYGAMCVCEPAVAVGGGIAQTVAHLEDDSLAAWQLPSTASGDLRSPDCVLIVALGSGPDAAWAIARQWDTELAHWSVPIRREVLQPGQLPSAAGEAAARAFSCVARIQAMREGVVVLRPRAALLPPRETSLSPLQGSGIWQLVRRPSSGRTPGALDSTFLVAERAEGLDVTAKVASRYRDPLQAVRDAPGNWLAVRVAPPGGQTTLRLTRTQGAVPLPGLEIVLPGEGSALDVLGTTDRLGEFVLEAGRTAGLRLIHVRLGEQSLASLPVLPGWPRRLELALSVDDRVLAAEAALSQIKLRVLELAARRDVVLARAKARASAGNKDAADSLLREWRQTETAEVQRLRQAIDAARQAHVTAAPSVAMALASLNKQLDPARVDQALAALRPAPPPPTVASTNPSQAASGTSTQPASSPAVPAGWKAFASQAAGMSALLPEGAVEQDQQFDLGSGPINIKFVAASADAGKLHFGLVQFDMPVLAGVSAEEALANAKLALEVKFEASVSDTQSIQVSGHAGQEVRGTAGTFYFRARLVVAGTRVFQAVAMSADEASLAGESAKRFFESFKITYKPQ
jgi:hypothetical protein